MKPLEKSVPVFPDHGHLIKPLEWSQAVCRCFCQQCGTMREINQAQATKLQKFAGQKISGNIKDFYFLVSYCEYCQEQELVVKIKQL